jgi:hypothetical protein
LAGEAVICRKCQFENPSGVKFCGECGAKLELVCPNCNDSNPVQFKFCGECGNSLISTEHLGPPKDLSFDEKLAKIQKYLPGGLTQEILSQRDRIEGERRHVTIMFIDMKGYTSLTERLGCHSTQVRKQASYTPFQSGCRMPEAILAIEQKQSSTIQDRSPLTIWGVARRVG